MATEKMTEYERKRLENIKRNDEMMAALKIHTKASLLSTAAKRRRVESKSYKASPEKKKNKSETAPIVIRRSLRTRGLKPDSSGLPADFSESPKSVSPQKPSPGILGPLAFGAAYSGSGSDKQFIDTILSVANKSHPGEMVKEEQDLVKTFKDEESSYSPSVRSELRGSTLASGHLPSDALDKEADVVLKEEPLDFPVKVEKSEFGGVLDLGSLTLEPDNIARIVPGKILVVKFLPSTDVRMVAAGNKFGNVGFWNLDCEDGKEDGIYLYRPHTGPVSSILFQESSLSKVITSCYDGLIRLMDAEKMVFDLVYSSDDAIYSLSQQPKDERSLYFGEGYGRFNVLDLRTGKSSYHWNLHEHRINSVDFNPQNPNIMATSSTDGTACLWDLRSMGSKKPRTLKTVDHERAVHSAYFSPSGCSLATTSVDNHVGVLGGVGFEDISMIYHNNQTSRWISNFRGIWGWDDSYIFIGNMARCVDVISPVQKKTVMTVQSPLMTAIPCRFDAHPLIVGMLAGATAGGQVYVWTRQ